MTARVSVVIPAWNAAATIGATLASVLAQTRPADEIVVIDDGSSDGTAAIVEALASRHAALRLVRQENAGPMRARNRGVAETTGDYVAPIDADDLWANDYLADMAAALERTGAGFAYALYRLIDADDRVLRDGFDFGVEGFARSRHWFVNFVGNGSAAVFRRDALLVAGGYDEATRAWGGAEDYLLQMRIAARLPVARVGRRLVGYRRLAGSYSSDPLAACQARLNAVRLAMSEAGAEGASAIARWVKSDAARTTAAMLLMQGGSWPALRLAATALMADPAATLADLGRRLRNAVARRTVGNLPLFFACDPDASFAPTPSASS